jgi:hypothetical protein
MAGESPKEHTSSTEFQKEFRESFEAAVRGYP